MKYFLIWSDYDRRACVEDFEATDAGRAALEKRYGQLMLFQQSEYKGTVVEKVVFGKEVSFRPIAVTTTWKIEE